MNVHLFGKRCLSEPVFDRTFCLLHERPHGQAQDESSRPFPIAFMHTVPKPREHDTRSFSETRGNTNQPIPANTIHCQPCLPLMARVSGHASEKLVECHPRRERSAASVSHLTQTFTSLVITSLIFRAA